MTVVCGQGSEISGEELLPKKSLPARRHHADGRRGPAWAEAAAVVAAAIKSRPAPAVTDVPVIIQVSPLALAARIRAKDRQAVGLLKPRPIARKKSIAVPAAHRMHL